VFRFAVLAPRALCRAALTAAPALTAALVLLSSSAMPALDGARR
jgi:hypothetical protein